MAPRRFLRLFGIVGLIAVFLLLIMPAVFAKCPVALAPGDDGGRYIEEPPIGGGPGTGGGGDNGDPDDISIYFQDPDSPSIGSGDAYQPAPPPALLRHVSVRASARYALLFLIGMHR